MSKFDYDIIVIGGGSAGLVSSKLAAGLGKKVLLIEKNKIGGECSYSGCVPSKAFIRTSKAFYEAKNLNTFNIKSKCTLDAKNVMKYVQDIVKKVAEEHKPEIFEKFGIKIKFGNPEFIDNHKIKLNNSQITSDKFIIASGSSPAIPQIDGLDKINFLTNNTFFEQKKLSNSMIILGGGPIGIELGQALNRLDVKTTIIQRNTRILMKDDAELSEMLQKILINEGLNILLKTQAIKIKKEKNKIAVYIQNNKNTNLKADALLIAAGRTPNIGNLKLENVGIEYNNKGIIVDDFLKTKNSNIYACGDVIGHYLFSHIAEYQAVIAGANACLPIKRKINYSNIIWTTFTDPEFAHAGFTEEQARNKYGDKIKIYKYNFKSLERAITDNIEFGIGKFILTKKGFLLGAHILGHNAGELLHEAQILKTLKIKFSKIQSVIHSYPTYSDITRQTGKKVYIDELQNNFLIKIIKFFKKGK